MFSFKNFFFLCIILLLTSCREDQPLLSSKASEVEKKYYEDYEVPEHKWGCINKQGEVVINPIYDDLKDMQSGLAAANFQGRWGYIDSLGKKAINFQYKQAYSFAESQTFVQDFDNSWLLIDMKGTVLDTLGYNTYEQYSKGYAVVGSDNFKGIIDSKGILKVPLEYESIKLCDDKIFIAKKNGLYGLKSIGGQELIPFDYQKIYSPKNKIYRLKKDRVFTYADQEGKLLAGSYVKAFDFLYDTTLVKDESGYKLVTKNQEISKALPYGTVQFAGESKWKFEENGKWGLLESDGSILAEPNYDLINRYSDGMIACSKGKLWGYMNQEGKEVISFSKPLVWDFHEGLARVIDQRGVGFLNKSGQLMIDDIFIEVRDFYNGRARFQTY